MRSLLCSRFLCISASGANVSAVSFRAPCATIPAKKQIRKICPETGECISDPFPTNQQTSGGSFCAGTFHAQQKAAGSRVKSTYRAENPTDFRQIACRPDIFPFILRCFIRRRPFWRRTSFFPASAPPRNFVRSSPTRRTIHPTFPPFVRADFFQ